ncbi:MAG: hypothetical protein QW075_05375 [Thermofilaceae archaeon]
MSDYVTVSAKIPRKLKELLEKCGAKPSLAIGKALGGGSSAKDAWEARSESCRDGR